MKTLLRALALILALSLAGGYVWNASRTPASPEESPDLSTERVAEPTKVVVPSILAMTTKSGIIRFSEGWVDVSKATTNDQGDLVAPLIPYEDSSVDRSQMRSAFANESWSDLSSNVSTLEPNHVERITPVTSAIASD